LKKRNKYCSYSCSHKATEKVQWENFDLLKLSSECSVEHIGRILKVSGNAVRKRLKKLKEKQFTNRESDAIVRE
jgi:predicted ArsR family transcriptional regulator